MIAERYGWRAKIGILSPGLSLTIMREWGSLLPEGITCSQAMMGVSDAATADGLRELRLSAVVEAMKLAKNRLMDIILFGCTSGSFIGGVGYDQEIVKELQTATNIPITTTSTCVLTAFADLGVKKIALVGPYIQEVFDIEIKFFKDHGIETLYCQGLEHPGEVFRIYEQPYMYYRLVKEAHRAAPDADAIFVTCMGSPIVRVVDVLEQETGKPVISSCSAALYGVLKQLGIKDPVEHYGRLLRMPR